MIKECPTCGKDFTVTNTQQYCSIQCFGKSQIGVKRSQVKLNCKVCQKEFCVMKCRLPRMYCSRLCSDKDYSSRLTEKGRETLHQGGLQLQMFNEKNGIGKGKNHWKYGTKDPAARERIIKLMQDGKMRKVFNTKPELEMKDLLSLLKIEYLFQKHLGNFMFDFELPRYHCLLEVDGVYWHSLPKTIERDKLKKTFAKQQGYKLIRVSSDELKNKEKVRERLLAELPIS